MANFIASNLKYLRKNKGENQDSIAVKVGKGATTIGNWEKGITEPNLTEIEILANFFEVNPVDLIFQDLSNGNLMENRNKIQNGNLIGNPTGNLISNSDQINLQSWLNIKENIIKTQKETIESQKETISIQKEYINVMNQKITKIVEENERLKRGIPEIGKDMESGSGSNEQTKIA